MNLHIGLNSDNGSQTWLHIAITWLEFKYLGIAQIAAFFKVAQVIST